MTADPLGIELANLLPGRTGHFRLESGHHGDLWLDLDALFLRPRAVRRFAVELARRLAPYRPNAVCGPLIGGGFLAQMVAAELDAELLYAERIAHPDHVIYRIPDPLRRHVRGKAVAVVDDVVNAGSAVRGTLADLRAGGAMPVAVAALLVLGDFAPDGLPLEALARRPNRLWRPADCPLCAAGVPLDDPGAGRSAGPASTVVDIALRPDRPT